MIREDGASRSILTECASPQFTSCRSRGSRQHPNYSLPARLRFEAVE